MSVVDNFTAPGRLPLTLLFIAFLTTFVITRTITRLIRAGKGPFHDNVASGVHIHHSIPGIILTIGGGFGSVAAHGAAPMAAISAILIGVGSSLVLDEFALLLHLQDVYWSSEGQLSVQVVMLTGAVLGLMALGVNPLENDGTLHVGSLVVLANLPVHLLAVVVTALVLAHAEDVLWRTLRRLLPAPVRPWTPGHLAPPAHDVASFVARCAVAATRQRGPPSAVPA